MKRHAKIGALVVLVGILAWASYTLELTRYLDPQEMRALLASYGSFGPLLFVGICIAGVLLHLPEMVLLILGGVLFGFWRGFLFGWLGAMIGATLSFLLVRYGARDTFQASLSARSPRLKAIDGHLEKHGFLTVLILRMVLMFAPPLNWIIALSRVKFRHYVAGSALGVIPGIAALCYFANSLGHVRSPSDLLTREIILPALLVLALLAVGAVAGLRLLGKKQSAAS